MIEYLLHAPSRTVFLAVMQALQNPVTGTPLAAIVNDELIGQRLVPSDHLSFDEIGSIGEVEGHHVNIAATGALEALLVAGMPAEGDVFARTRILSLLGDMEWQPISAEGVPEGWEGASGVRIFDPVVVASRKRV